MHESLVSLNAALRTPPAREVLAQSRTLKGGGAPGVATVGAAGVEVAQQVLAETQGAVLPLVPYLDTVRWLFVAVAPGGIAVAIYARLHDGKREQFGGGDAASYFVVTVTRAVTGFPSTRIGW